VSHATAKWRDRHRRQRRQTNAVNLTWNNSCVEWGEGDKVYFYLGSSRVNLQHCFGVV
jgi:hypothetical protein